MVPFPSMESPQHYRITDYPSAAAPIHILVTINPDVFIPIPGVVVRRVGDRSRGWFNRSGRWRWSRLRCRNILDPCHAS